MKHLNLSFSHAHICKGQKVILDDESFSIRSGEFNLLCGNNGVGKTTLLRIIAGLEKPGSADIDYGNGSSSWRRSRKQLRDFSVYLHQHPYMLDGSVRNNLAYALLQHRMTTKEKNLLIDEALELAQIRDISDSFAKTLSGGEQQRVALARAWLRQPRIMLLDEPMTNMDMKSRNRTTELLSLLKQQGLAICVACHDTEQFSNLVDNTFVLHDGRLTADKVASHQTVYTAPKLASNQVAA
jgi:ABC-type multidrug transport system ATPase subunit